MPLPCGCCVLVSHCLGWSDSQWSPQQTSVRRSVVSEENLTTNIHHWQRRGGTLGCRGGRHHWDWRVFSPAVALTALTPLTPAPSLSSWHIFSGEAATWYGPPIRACSREQGQVTDQWEAVAAWTLQSQSVLSPGQPTAAGELEAREDLSSQCTSHDPY